MAEGGRIQLLLAQHITDATDPTAVPVEIDRALDMLERAYLKHWAIPLAKLLRGRVAFLRGQDDRAMALMQQAAEESHLPTISAHARFAHGTLLGGERGNAMRSASLRLLSDWGVVDPLRYLRGHLPELVEGR